MNEGVVGKICRMKVVVEYRHCFYSPSPAGIWIVEEVAIIGNLFLSTVLLHGPFV